MKGSTIKRGHTWTAYWFTTDPGTGKRRQHSKGGFRIERDAQRHLNGIIDKVETGQWKADAKVTVKQLLSDHWLPAKRMSGRRPATIDHYETVVDSWLVPHIGEIVASTLNPGHVQQLLEVLAATKTARGRKGLSGRSRQMAVGTLKSAYSWAVKTGLLQRNPIAGVDRPGVGAQPSAAWTIDEARAFLAATRDHRLAFAWALLLTRGLRRGDVCGLRWSDVDLDAGRASIQTTRIVVDGKALESQPKTRRGVRTIPLDANLIGLLKAHWARQAVEKLAAGEGAYEDGGWLVADELGRPYHPSTISAWFEDEVAKAGLRRIRLHDTRHTAASLMLADGVPVHVVAQLLGQDPRVTLATYAHVIPGMAEKAGEALSTALLGGHVDKVLTCGASEDSSGADIVPLSRDLVAGGGGLEPPTSGSKVRCSAN